MLNGVSGYANKQAAICSCMAQQCAHYWLPCLAKKGITPSWESDFGALLPVQSEGAGNDIEGFVDAEDCPDNSEDSDADSDAGGDDDDFDLDD